jgi:DNA polymerase
MHWTLFRSRFNTEGAALMKMLCVPRTPTQDEQKADPDWRKHYFWEGTPEDFAREGLYCMQDVRAEEALSDALPDLSPVEQRIWLKSLRINDRGVHIDSHSVEALKVCTDVERRFLSEEFVEITGIESPTMNQRLIEYLKENGVETDSLGEDAVSELLKSDLAPDVRRALEIRLACSKSSTAKLTPMIEARNKDGRIRSSFLYYRAVTGRWSGRVLQPQNFPRGILGTDERVDACLAAFNKGDLGLIRHDYGDVMTAASSCLRAMIVPAPGKDFVCADFSSVEGRVLAWLAGEETALNVYREGRDPYKVNAAQIYGVGYGAVSKDQRQVGKVAELALGYQGSIGAFSRMGENYGVELPEDEIMVIVRQWRMAHPMTKRLWNELDKCAKNAIRYPGAEPTYRGIKFKCDGQLLQMMLPSRRTLCYRSPEIAWIEKDWGWTESILYLGDKDKQKELYGGTLTENLTQAVARDLLANAIFNVEIGGYPVVLHVHDELVAEVPEGFGSVKELCELMCRLPPWAAGLPLNAEGWRGKRYRKG